ncbi:hypothetical protein [Leucobacter chinensis]|uniref:hypothetical protein n=1 Tax=Leucobacter chinensis TaxID=2851010 RepID=UPI001C246383|nr:hypothetical protein [Leucobacter chinensis]
MKYTTHNVLRPGERVQPPLGVRRAASVLLVCAGLVFTVGCGATEMQESSETPAPSAAVVDGVVGELAAVESDLEVGQDIAVLVPLPREEWEVFNSDKTVVEIEHEETSPDVTVVRLTAIAEGESTVIFQSKDDTTDEITLTVTDVPAS